MSSLYESRKLSPAQQLPTKKMFPSINAPARATQDDSDGVEQNDVHDRHLPSKQHKHRRQQQQTNERQRRRSPLRSKSPSSVACRRCTGVPFSYLSLERLHLERQCSFVKPTFARRYADQIEGEQLGQPVDQCSAARYDHRNDEHFYAASADILADARSDTERRLFSFVDEQIASHPQATTNQ